MVERPGGHALNHSTRLPFPQGLASAKHSKLVSREVYDIGVLPPRCLYTLVPCGQNTTGRTSAEMQSPPGRLTLNPNSLLALVSVRREAVSEVGLMGERGRAPEDILLREVMRDIVASGVVAE